MNNKAQLVFNNGLIVTPGGVIQGGVAVSQGKIVAVGNDAFLPEREGRIDLFGKHLLPE